MAFRGPAVRRVGLVSASDLRSAVSGRCLDRKARLFLVYRVQLSRKTCNCDMSREVFVVGGCFVQ